MHLPHCVYKVSGAEQAAKGLKRSNSMFAEVGAAAPPMGDLLTNRPANQTPTNKAASLGSTH